MYEYETLEGFVSFFLFSSYFLLWISRRRKREENVWFKPKWWECVRTFPHLGTCLLFARVYISVI